MLVMNSTIILFLIAFCIYWAYNTSVLSIFGAPYSLSRSYYLFEERKKWQKYLFPLTMISTAFFLLPSWLMISEGSDYQVFSFLTAAGIMFVGLAPAFLTSKMENKIHTISAFAAALFALLWILVVAKMWYLIITWFLIIAVVAILTKTVKTAFVYWLETIVFMSTFTSMICHYIN